MIYFQDQRLYLASEMQVIDLGLLFISLTTLNLEIDFWFSFCFEFLAIAVCRGMHIYALEKDTAMKVLHLEVICYVTFFILRTLISSRLFKLSFSLFEANKQIKQVNKHKDDNLQSTLQQFPQCFVIASVDGDKYKLRMQTPHKCSNGQDCAMAALTTERIDLEKTMFHASIVEGIEGYDESVAEQFSFSQLLSTPSLNRKILYAPILENMTDQTCQLFSI